MENLAPEEERPAISLASPISHAKWLLDAMRASEEASEYAKHYCPLDRDWEIEKQDRAVAFHRQNSGDKSSLLDAIMDAVRWHMPPDDVRVFEDEMNYNIAMMKAKKIIEDAELGEKLLITWREKLAKE